MLFLLDAFEAIQSFFRTGGLVLQGICVVIFVLWYLILDKFTYFKTSYKKELQTLINNWSRREDHHSWNAHAIREKMISEMRVKIHSKLSMIKTLIAVCPLLGLMGTVTGMIVVFGSMASTGGGDVKSMADGVSMATIPTMAGMVAALSGVLGNTFLTQIAERESNLIEEKLTFKEAS